jgi:hypothetical protein
MQNAIKMERDKLSISLGYLYDAMDEHHRIEFLDFVCGHDRLIQHVCQAVGGGHQVEPIFSDDLRDKCLKSLMPLLDSAAAKSLADALCKAEKYKKAEDQLRTMAHVYSMMAEADGDLRTVRANQWAEELLRMKSMYQEYQGGSQ